MNLGQLIGELRLRAEAAGVGSPTPGLPPARPAGAVQRGSRHRQVLELLADGRAMGVADVAAALLITGDHAGVLLHGMKVKGEIARHGEPRGYLYTLPGIKLQP